MFLSLIVPVYNVEKYIDQCIQSILSQSFVDFELILVDDGSPDNCGIICDNYAKNDSRIKVIHQRNAGLSAARNSGLKIAEGEYIWFIDSDDWIATNSLSIINEELNREKVEMLGFSLIEFYEKSNIFSKPFLLNSIKTGDGNSYLKKEKLFTASACTYIYSLNFLKKHNQLFKIGLIHEDDLFNLECFSNVEKIKKIPKALYYYRKRENSIINSEVSIKKIKSYQEIIKLCNKLRVSSLEREFIDKQILRYISTLFLLLKRRKTNNHEKFKIITNIKIQTPKLIKFNKDSTLIKLEKNLFNLNINFYYFYLNNLRWFSLYIEKKITNFRIKYSHLIK